MNITYIIPALLFICLGIGMLFDQEGPAVIIGLGLGLLTYAILCNRQTKLNHQIEGRVSK
ncbi:hypothetical protein ERX37_05905 [Macrococcus hajekii]|uniref:Uncharacterized protein n=1 Tax=Macrococcus hajekii TaxID=198482 RepID=A0A4V3BDX8_9STAP|nr:hypothetical protein [Macrococcus hajekii]TDM01744.1 hypothetical protein ERX37_05905 [Macrococcus hajekii]GGB07055.1 hypothetical protein GCM10007190_13880 [Macrococcus hajekii]